MSIKIEPIEENSACLIKDFDPGTMFLYRFNGSDTIMIKVDTAELSRGNPAVDLKTGNLISMAQDSVAVPVDVVLKYKFIK